MITMEGIAPALLDPRAACGRTSDPDMMFQEKRGDWGPARRVCASCPLDLRAACLRWALSPGTRQEYGMWGGTTPRERRKILKDHAIRIAARAIPVAG